MIRAKENYWLLEGVANETAKMIKLWDMLVDNDICYDFSTVCRWKSSFKDILEAMNKQCDEMEEVLKELNEDAHYEWSLCFPEESPVEAPKSVAV